MEIDLNKIKDTAGTVIETTKDVIKNREVGRIIVGTLKTLIPSVNIKAECDTPYYTNKTEISTKEIICNKSDKDK